MSSSESDEGVEAKAEFTGDEVVAVTPSHISIDGHKIRTCLVDGVKMASVVDYVMLVRGLNRDQAGLYVRRLSKKHSVKTIACQFTNGGMRSPGIRALDLVKLTFAFASGARVATEIVDKWTTNIARIEGGDETLKNEIDENAALAKANPKGPQAFFQNSLQGEQSKRVHEADDQSSIKHRALTVYEPEYWLQQGMTPLETVNVMEKMVVVYERKCLAEATTELVLSERERGVNIDRGIVSNRELHKQRLEEMDKAHEHARETQQLIKKLDARYYLMRQLNKAQTAEAKDGPCMYFVDALDTTVMFGHTGVSLAERYRREKNYRAVLANTLLALPATDKTHAANMEAAFKGIVSSNIKGMRIGRFEALINNFDLFVMAMEKWNEHAAIMEWPQITLP